MAELVDALGSGPSGGNTVEVRVLFWAPRFPLSEHFHSHAFPPKAAQTPCNAGSWDAKRTPRGQAWRLTRIVAKHGAPNQAEFRIRQPSIAQKPLLGTTACEAEIRHGAGSDHTAHPAAGLTGNDGGASSEDAGRNAWSPTHSMSTSTQRATKRSGHRDVAHLASAVGEPRVCARSAAVMRAASPSGHNRNTLEDSSAQS